MTEQPVYLFVKWQVKAEHLQEVLNILPQLIADSREEDGNLIYRIHQSNSEAQTLMLYEGYKDQAALDAHRNTAHFQNFVINQIVPLLESRELTIASEL